MARRKGTTLVTLDGERAKPSSRGRRGTRVPRPIRRGARAGAVGNYMQDAWSLAKRTAVGLNEIRKLINVEHKYLDTGNSVTCSQAGNAYALNLIAQGDDLNQRDGDAVKLQTLEFSAEVSTGGATGLARIMIVKDAENGGATITGSDVLQNAGSGYAPLSFPNFINSPNIQSRFSIILDQVVKVHANNPVEIVRFRSTHDVHLYYRGSTAALASLASGALFVVFITDLGANQPTVLWQSRIVFTDN